jgi:hypothetical protein
MLCVSGTDGYDVELRQENTNYSAPASTMKVNIPCLINKKTLWIAGVVQAPGILHQQ